MIVLVLTVCALSTPDCVDVRLPFADVGLITCMTSAGPIAAQWIDEHPGRRLARWRCAEPDEGDPT